MEQDAQKELVRARYGGIAEAASAKLLRAGFVLLRSERRSRQQIP
jgi:hypothetical protein